MCDYSLRHVASRPAKVADKIVTTRFANSITRGFTEVGVPEVAVCLLPGTELAFEREIECDGAYRFLPRRRYAHKVARFRQINLDDPTTHHDALEFPGGETVLVTQLCEGQRAAILQLPAGALPGHGEHGEATEVPQRLPIVA